MDFSAALEEAASQPRPFDYHRALFLSTPDNLSAAYIAIGAVDSRRSHEAAVATAGRSMPPGDGSYREEVPIRHVPSTGVPSSLARLILKIPLMSHRPASLVLGKSTYSAPDIQDMLVAYTSRNFVWVKAALEWGSQMTHAVLQ
jgi:hypothetical protein